MDSGVENCCRIDAADKADDERAYVGSRSMTVTLTVGSDNRKKYAIELPITPPPTITTFELTYYSTSRVAAPEHRSGTNGIAEATCLQELSARAGNGNKKQQQRDALARHD
jgi:hypothetical protein